MALPHKCKFCTRRERCESDGIHAWICVNNGYASFQQDPKNCWFRETLKSTLRSCSLNTEEDLNETADTLILAGFTMD